MDREAQQMSAPHILHQARSVVYYHSASRKTKINGPRRGAQTALCGDGSCHRNAAQTRGALPSRIHPGGAQMSKHLPVRYGETVSGASTARRLLSDVVADIGEAFREMPDGPDKRAAKAMLGEIRERVSELSARLLGPHGCVRAVSA